MKSSKEKKVSYKVITREALLKETHTESIIEAFLFEFEEILVADNPTNEHIKQVFDWLKHEGNSAVTFAEINALQKIRRTSERTFSKSIALKKIVWNESKNVGRELKRRFEELRTTRRSTKGRIPIFEGHREEEKALPQN